MPAEVELLDRRSAGYVGKERIRRWEDLVRLGSVLANDAILVERYAEQCGREIPDRSSAVARTWGPYCRTRPDARDRFVVRPKSRAEAPDEARDIATLRAVVGVELIEDKVPQCVRPVVRPERTVFRPEQQEVEHP